MVTPRSTGVKFLAPLRGPKGVLKEIERKIRMSGMKVGPFILAACMEKAGYGKKEVQNAIMKGYPRRTRKEQ